MGNKKAETLKETPIVRCSHAKLVNVDELKSHPKNANLHPNEQVERLAKIIQYQGWRYPIKVSNRSGYITSGHGRLMAAQLKGWTTVPVDFQDYDSDDQELADVHADNSIASWAELDLSKINSQIELLGPDFDVELLGLKDFTIDVAEKFDLDEKQDSEKETTHVLEVQFKKEKEMMEVYDELLSRGLIVRCK